MGEYQVNHRYTSKRDGINFGPYEPGATVELLDADAEWVNRDSPGTLTPVTELELIAEDEAADASEEAAEAATEGEAPPVRDRAHRGGRRRAGS
jgi:hypothetical protein